MAGKEEINMDWKALRSTKLIAIGKRFELFPIVGVVGAVTVGLIAASIYGCYNKLDILFDRKAPPRHEKVDLLNPTSRKLIHISQVYTPLPELHNILQEMKEEERKQAEEAASK